MEWHRLGRVLFPICCGTFGLCLPGQVLKFSWTKCTWDFYPLHYSWACFLLIFSSSLHMKLCDGEEQLPELLWVTLRITEGTWVHSLLQPHKLWLVTAAHPCRTHLSQAGSCTIRGVFGTWWLNNLTELGTSFLLHESGIFSKALLLCGGHLDTEGALAPMLWESRFFLVSWAIMYKHWAPGGWSWIWPVVSEDHFRSWYET